MMTNNRFFTEGYRSGHNEAVLKTVWAHAHVGSNPTPSAKTKQDTCRCPVLFWRGVHGRTHFAKQSVGSHSRRKPTGACSQEARRRILTVGEYPTPSARALEHYVPRLFSFLCITMLSPKQLQHTTKSFISPEIIRDYSA